MLVAALGLAAAPIPRIQFTDTKLANGLRLIVSRNAGRGRDGSAAERSAEDLSI